MYISYVPNVYKYFTFQITWNVNLLSTDIKQGHVKLKISRYWGMKGSNKAIQSGLSYLRYKRMWLCTQTLFAFVDSQMATFNRVGNILFDHVYHDRKVQ